MVYAFLEWKYLGEAKMKEPLIPTCFMFIPSRYSYDTFKFYRPVYMVFYNTQDWGLTLWKTNLIMIPWELSLAKIYRK